MIPHAMRGLRHLIGASLRRAETPHTLRNREVALANQARMAFRMKVMN